MVKVATYYRFHLVYLRYGDPDYLNSVGLDPSKYSTNQCRASFTATQRILNRFYPLKIQMARQLHA